MSERIEATLRMLLDSGAITPMGARVLRRLVLMTPANVQSAWESPMGDTYDDYTPPKYVPDGRDALWQRVVTAEAEVARLTTENKQLREQVDGQFYQIRELEKDIAFWMGWDYE